MSQSQLYAQDGSVLEGATASTGELIEAEDLVEANSHVWLWRKTPAGVVEVLLQRRADQKLVFPNFLHVSAGGGVDAGETPQQSAVRETREEVGITIAAEDLYLVFCMRGLHRRNDLMYVFTAQLHGTDHPVTMQPDEVSEVIWLSLEQLRAWTGAPLTHDIIEQRRGYFENLVESIQYQAGKA